MPNNKAVEKSHCGCNNRFPSKYWPQSVNMQFLIFSMERNEKLHGLGYYLVANIKKNFE